MKIHKGQLLKGPVTQMLTRLLVLSETGPTSTFYGQGLESTPQLYNENRVLKEENRSLQAQLSHMSRGGWSKATNCGHSRVPLFPSHTNHQLEKQREEVEITDPPQIPIGVLSLERATS